MGKWKTLPALLAMVMVLALTVTAFASEDNMEKYSDITGHWAEEEISRILALGLMDGKTDTAFAPNENMTRAGLVVALYRLAGSPEPAADMKNPFQDVSGSDAYRDAVVWASGKGIVNGKTPDTFSPDGSVTRQELAKILNLYAAQAVEKPSLRSRVDKLAGYPDAADVSSWAGEYMNWAAASEFIGSDGGKLNPKGTVTRAQAAAILCRYLDDNATGDASKDNPRNEDGIGENELLVVSFGTSFNDSRAATIGGIESALEEAFPDYSVRRGFTSDTIIEHIFRRDGVAIDNVTEALERAKRNGVKNLVVQPTHLMNGYEYGDLVQELGTYADDFETIRIGDPLLTSDEDYAAVAAAMLAATAGFDGEKTAVCYMGHGTEAASNGVYDKMQQLLSGGGHANYFVGTVEAEPSVETVLKLVQAGEYERVVLRPMMIVAGDHAVNDMAGNGGDSWKSVFTAAGYEVVSEIKGLGELEGIQQLLTKHAKEAKTLGETGITVEPNPENVKPKALADGVYTITVSCKESMFKIDSCELTVEDGKMTAALTLGSESFDKMFVGTADSAAAAQEGIVEGIANGGKTTFTLSVSALDEELRYAAHSVKKDAWYDRNLTFDSAAAEAK